MGLEESQCAASAKGLSVEGVANLPKSNFPFRSNKLPIYYGPVSPQIFYWESVIHCRRESPESFRSVSVKPDGWFPIGVAFPTLAGLVGLYVIVS